MLLDTVIVDEWPDPVEINVYPNDHHRGGQPMARFKGVVAIENDGEFMRVFQSYDSGTAASGTVPISKLSFWCVLKADAP